MTPEETIYNNIGQQLEGASKGQMFGKPCFKINGKAFICFFQNEMVFKLSGLLHSEALRLPGAGLFDPSGKKRAMKEWVQVPAGHSHKWTEYAHAALQYVAGQ